jgi:hypothetical protein
VSRDVLDHLVKHQVPDRHAFTHPAPDCRRGNLDQRHVEVAHALRPRHAADLDHDRVAAPAHALEHGQRRLLEHLLGLVPARQRRRLVAAQDQEQLVLRRLREHLLERVGCVGRALAVDLDARGREALVVRDRELDHLEPRLRAGVVLQVAVRRLADRNEDHRVELQLHQRLLSADQVADVRRVECSSQDAYAQTGYSRT